MGLPGHSGGLGTVWDRLLGLGSASRLLAAGDLYGRWFLYSWEPPNGRVPFDSGVPFDS
ncbi:MAG TPA: hypothetical protein VIQ30_22920 [Pseudonocardia sp.]